MKTTFCFIETVKEKAYQDMEYTNFLFLVQRGALLGLRDAGILTEAQHRFAEKLLYKEHKELLSGGKIE